jgi:hypothetical protein
MHILKLMMRGQMTAKLCGGLLAVLVLLMGAALLGLSGWFITAEAAAGLAGTGVVFDVCRPGTPHAWQSWAHVPSRRPHCADERHSTAFG